MHTGMCTRTLTHLQVRTRAHTLACLLMGVQAHANAQMNASLPTTRQANAIMAYVVMIYIAMAYIVMAYVPA